MRVDLPSSTEPHVLKRRISMGWCATWPRTLKSLRASNRSDSETVRPAGIISVPSFTIQIFAARRSRGARTALSARTDGAAWDERTRLSALQAEPSQTASKLDYCSTDSKIALLLSVLHRRL